MKDMEILCPPLMKWIKSSKSKQRRTSADVEKRIGNPNPPEYDTAFRFDENLLQATHHMNQYCQTVRFKIQQDFVEVPYQPFHWFCH